jgi:hypothetical protein
MNMDMDPVAIDLSAGDVQTVGMVSTVTNMLFERGLIIPRTDISPRNSTLGADYPRALRSLPFAANTGTVGQFPNVLLTRNATGPVWKLWKMQTDNVGYPLTQITGPAIADTWNNLYLSTAVANGVVLLGGHPDGLFRWDPTGSVYTRIATAPYSFVTSMYSRAIAAYKLTGALGDPITMAWSVAGNETDWTNYGSGSSVLTDIPDQITGLAVIRNVLVILRSYGLHLGYPTGTFPALFNFSNFSNSIEGCLHPATIDVWRNVLFFVSNAGIHTFDLNTVENIGEGVFKEVLSTVNGYGGVLRGFVSQSYTLDSQPTYNLLVDVVQSPQTVNLALPHWQYNLKERKWNRLNYNTGVVCDSELGAAVWDKWAPTLTGAAIQPTPNIAIVQRLTGPSNKINAWTQATGTTSPTPQFTTGQLEILPGHFDAEMTGVMLTYNTLAASPGFSVLVTYQQAGQQITSAVFSQTGPTGTGWQRVWIRFRLTGNLFKILVFLSAGDIKLKEMLIEFNVQGAERI